MKFECIKCGICCKNLIGKIKESSLLASGEHLNAVFLAQPIDKIGLSVFDWEKEIMEEEGRKLDIQVRFLPLHFLVDKIDEKAVVLSWMLSHINCPFLKNDECLIYEKRPLICRSYPITFLEIKKSFDGFDIDIEISKECPKIVEIEFDENVYFDEFVRKYYEIYGETFKDAVLLFLVNSFVRNLIKILIEKDLIFVGRIEEINVKKMFEQKVGFVDYLEENKILGRNELKESLKNLERIAERIVKG